MTTWTRNELTKVGSAEELEIQALRADGALRKPVTIWVVRVGDDLYVRAVNGRTGVWFRGAQVRHEGHIRAGGVDSDVTYLEEADPDLNDMIDTAYRTKYQHYGERIVGSIVSAEARAATIKLVPRVTGL